MSMMMYSWIVISALVYSVQSQTSIIALSNVTKLIQENAYFNWSYPSSVDIVDWYFGNTDKITIMSLEDGVITKNKLYNVDYCNDSTCNIGMVMYAVTLNNTGQYSVEVFTSNGTSESSSTYLIVKVPSNSDLQKKTSILINDLPSEQFNDLEIPAGGVTITVTSDLYDISGQCHLATNSIDGNCEGTKCTFPTFETRTGDQIIVNISYVDIDKFLTATLTATVSDTKSLAPWLIAVIVVVVLAVCAILIAIIVLQLKKKSSMKNGTTKTDDKPPPGTAGEVSSATLPPSSPKTLSGVTVEDDRIPQNTVSSPRRLPPLIPLPPVNRINPEINNDGSEHETKKKRKKKKHKKREHEDKNEAENGVDNQTFGNTD